MRRQCEMVLNFDDQPVDAILACDTAAELRVLENLEAADADVLAATPPHTDLFGMAERDAEALLALSDRIRLLGEAEYSAARHEFLLRRTFTIAKAIDDVALRDALEDREAAEAVVRYINTEKTGSPETNKNYRTALRMFGGLLSDGPAEDKPESIAWIPGGYPSNYDPAPDPSRMYRWDEHIRPMLDACHTSRDRALIALAWDLGPRPGELYDLTVDSFADHKYGLQVTLSEGEDGHAVADPDPVGTVRATVAPGSSRTRRARDAAVDADDTSERHHQPADPGYVQGEGRGGGHVAAGAGNAVADAQVLGIVPGVGGGVPGPSRGSPRLEPGLLGGRAVHQRVHGRERPRDRPSPRSRRRG